MIWKLESLDELCDFKNGLWKGKKEPFIEVGVIRNTNFTKSGTLDDSDIAYLDVEQKQYATRQLQFGDLILEKSGGGPKQPVGRVIVFDKQSGDFSFSNFTSVVRIKDKTKLDFSFLHKYLYFLYITGATESMQRQSTGIRNLQLKDYKLIDVPLPPIPEQQRIVAILDQAFADIEKARANAERNLKNARELFDSYLNQVFSQRGEGWVEDSVGNMAEHNLGKMLDKQKNKGDLRPYLRNLSVRWFDFNLDDILKMRFEDREVDRYSVRKGDLMICEGGYPGRAAIWDNSETMFYQKAIHRVRFKNTVYNKWLLYYLYLSDSNETLRTHFTGAGIQHFTGKALGALRLAFPPERDAYVILADIEKLHDLVRELEQPYERKLASLDELKKSLLQKAFSGELTKTEDMVA